MENSRIDSLVKIAIGKEIESNKLYSNLAEKAADKTVKETLELLAAEELRHQKILEGYLDGKVTNSLKPSSVVDYKIAEHEEKPQADTIDVIKDVYLFAAHEELAAYQFYLKLAQMHEEGEAKNLLLQIANEEMKHKEKVEYYYTNSAFPEDRW